MSRAKRLTSLIGAMALCMAAAPAIASASVGTGIKGVVTEAAAAKQPIQGLCVAAYKPGGSRFEAAQDVAATNVAGEYEIALAAGSYDVEFFKCEPEAPVPGANTALNYATRYYDETPLASSAMEVTVQAGKMTEGIDSEMWVGGQIEGELLNGKGQVAGEVCVVAIPAEGGSGMEVVSGKANASGHYALDALSSGGYHVVYYACGGANVVEAYYDESSAPDHRGAYAESTMIKVEERQATPVDTASLKPVTLEAGGLIEGTIEDSEGQTITAPMCVIAVQSSNPEEFPYFTFTYTGHYAIEGLGSGSYDVAVEECHESGKPTTWAGQFYNGAAKISEATPVSVTAGLEPPVPATADFRMVRTSAVKPASTAAPAISGAAAVGQTLTCAPGTWTGTPTPTFSYQWSRNGVAIGGATSSSYLVQAADAGTALTCTVTATNEAGSASEISAAFEIPAPPPPAKEEVKTPPPAPTPGVGLVLGTGTVKGEDALLKLRCSGGGACEGTLQLVYEEKMKKVVKRDGKKRVRHVVKLITLGEAHFSIAADGQEALQVTLSRKGADLVKKAGKHGLRVKVAGEGIKARSMRLQAAKGKGKGKAKGKGKHHGRKAHR